MRLFVGTLTLSLLLTCASPSIVSAQENIRPPLIITNAPLPEALRNNVYSKPARAPGIEAGDIIDQSYYQSVQSTPVSQRVQELSGTLYNLQNKATSVSENLNVLQRENEQKSAAYYASIATINTQLQVGTTPGNPRLVRKIDEARNNYDSLSVGVKALNELSDSAAKLASEGAFLLESARAAYSLSGAIEEDHIQLAELEDATNNTLVIIDRLLNTVNDDITRTNTYLSSERNNLRTLSLAVANGDLYGTALASRPFSNAPQYEQGFIPASTGGAATAGAPQAVPVAPVASSGLSGPRPLVKIRFDRPDVEYEQPVFMAVNEALERYPDARFDLVAIHPSAGNAAEVAIESTRSRRNAEAVLRTLTQMGLDTNRVDLSYDKSDTANSSEVHIFVK